MPGCESEPRRPNVVIVVLDTLRRDATSLAADSPGLTPHLDALADESVVFTHAFSAAPWTVPSHASMMTGLLPSGHNCVSLRPRLDPRIPTLAQLAGEAGYATGAFYSNPWLSDKATQVLRGFEVQEQAEITGLFQLESQFGDQGGREISGDVSRWLGGRADDGRPFLMFVNILESHLSYDPPKVYRDEHLKDLHPGETVSIKWAHEYNAGLHPHDGVNWSIVERLYAGDVWSADRFLGEILQSLEREGLAENTVVIVTSDHGENLGDHGLMEHQFSLHETLLAVPLVVRVPIALRGKFDLSARSGERRHDPVQTTDLFATVLDIVGDDIYASPPSSRSLFEPPAEADRPLFAEYAGPAPGLLEMLRERHPAADVQRYARAIGSVRVGDLRLTADDRGSVELHDIARDPGQARDISAAHPEAVEALMQLLLRASRSASENLTPVEIDPETRRQLESLGYIH